MRAALRLSLGVCFIACLVVACGRLRKKGEIEPAPSFSVAAGSAQAPSPGTGSKASAPTSSGPAGAPEGGARPAPSGYVDCQVGGVARMPGGTNAVLLVQKGTRIALPIFIGGTEALSIQLRLGKKAYPRPLTHDLLDRSVTKLGGHVESVRVDKIEDNTFLGTVVIASGKERFELDARPSDAIALALGNAAPIHVAKDVLDRAGIDLDKVRPEPVEELPLDERPPPVSL